jgi:hypothetical protein
VQRLPLLKHIEGWRYAGPTGRDERLDLLRGYAVFAMVVDHVGGASWLLVLTGGDQFLVSAAEAFVFISGFLMGQVYGRRIERRGWLEAAEAILHRAVLLYLVTVALTLFFVGLFLFTDLQLWLDRAYGLGLTDPVQVVVGTLTLHYTYHGTDILWMYTVLVAAAPLLFHLLVTGRTRHLVAGSVSLWLAYQLFPSQATIPWAADNAVYFPVAAWQILFVAGLAVGYHRPALSALLAGLPRWPALMVMALGMLGLLALFVIHESGRIGTVPGLRWLAGDTWDVVFDKPSVSWGRLLGIGIAAPFFFLLVTVLWNPLVRATGWLLLPLGQSALVAYSAHLVVIVVVYNMFGALVATDSWTVNAIGQLLTVAIVWQIVLVWQRIEFIEDRLHAWWSTRLPLTGARRWQALGLAAMIIGAAAAAWTLWVGPIQASRPVAAVTEASPAETLLFVPDDADGPVTAMIVLPDTGGTGPRAAAALVEAARTAGWAIFAPTIEQAAWESPDDARASAARVLPELARLVHTLESQLGHPVEPRVLLLGRGRGGQLAYTFALVYPELVRAVGLVDVMPCTLPVASDFPEGTGDAASLLGHPIDQSAYQDLVVALIRPIPADGPDALVCEWANLPIPAQEQLNRTVRELKGAGMKVVIRSDSGGGPGRAVEALQLAMLESER